MAPRKLAQPTAGTSRALVNTGRKDVLAKPQLKSSGDVLQTTSRALILRNGKYGARGTGEVTLVGRISGREKLDLLAEDLVEKSAKTAIGRPFRRKDCIKIADSQTDAYLDELSSLMDPGLFEETIHRKASARQTTGAISRPSELASLVGTVIHNAYMQASAWKLVSETLRDLEADGVGDDNVKHLLRSDDVIRSRYLALYELVNVLVNLNQQKVSILATTTPHYQDYFKPSDSSEPGEPGMTFDWQKLSEACKSFIDSIILELCFPRAPYPRFILCQILHDAVEESPKDARRFSQELWDAVGDLSVTVELQELLERPLLGPDGENLKRLPYKMPEQYGLWLNAQLQSDRASSYIDNYKDLICPVHKTRDKKVLENMWMCINENYKSVSGQDIDALWLLQDRSTTPQWHSFYFPGQKTSFDRGESRPSSKKPLAITNHPANDDEDHDSMPELQSLSSDPEESSSGSGSDWDEESDQEHRSDYDEDYEDMLRELRREAMDLAHDIPGFFDHHTQIPQDIFAEERKGNPFLALLGSLRATPGSSISKITSSAVPSGRMFSSSPKLRSAKKEPDRTSPSVVSPSHISPPPAPTPQDVKEVGPSPIEKVTVEEVEDENSAHLQKKKKKHKKKKKAPSLSQSPVPSASNSSPLVQSSIPVVSQEIHPPSVLSKLTPSKPVRNRLQSPSTDTFASSLSIHRTVAESARKYIQSEHLDAPKTKIKSRPDPSTSSSEPIKKTFWSKFSRKTTTDIDEKQMKEAKRSWFTRLTKRTSQYMRQLLRTSDDETKGLASMKWEHFLKLMQEMGFSIDASTAGSSVRFDPPDPRDKPISIHKPHPDPSLSPVMLRNIAKRLKGYYGWCEEDLSAHA